MGDPTDPLHNFRLFANPYLDFGSIVLKCTWNLETCTVGFLVYEDSNILVFNNQHYALIGVDVGDFFQNFYLIWAMKSPQAYPASSTFRLFWKIQACPIVFKKTSVSFKYPNHDYGHKIATVMRDNNSIFVKNSNLSINLKIHTRTVLDTRIMNFTIINRYCRLLRLKIDI